MAIIHTCRFVAVSSNRLGGLWPSNDHITHVPSMSKVLYGYASEYQ